VTADAAARVDALAGKLGTTTGVEYVANQIYLLSEELAEGGQALTRRELDELKRSLDGLARLISQLDRAVRDYLPTSKS